MELDTFTRAYVECALWSSMDESDPNTGGESLDQNYTVDDIDPATLADMAEDCRRFQAEHGDLIASDPARAGHDFWLTRNRHGAGFWDGDWPEETGRKLTDAAHVLDSYDLYLGDDGRVYGR
jgi:hypothetical protein